MAPHKRFHLQDLEMLRAELTELGLTLPLEEDLHELAEQVAVGRRQTANRLAVHPMEGFDSTPDGSPSELSFRRYRRYAEGGSGLIWFEATAVLHEARSNPHQLVLDRDNVDVYARLVDATRQAARKALDHDLVLVVQLTHSGRYSKPTGVPQPMIAHHSAVLDPLHKLSDDYPLVSDEYLDRLQEIYVEAARLAARAGFDGVDIKSCHRYLVSELLASYTRPGRYGGSLENRSRLLRETVQRIAQTVPEIFVTTRMNVYDAIPYPYGFGVRREDHAEPDLAEPLAVIRELLAAGLPLLNVTIGNPYYQPHYGRPYDWPIVGGALPDEHPLRGVVRFVQITRQVQEAFPALPVIGTGYSWLRHLLPYVAAGVVGRRWATLIGQGRGAFAYPDSAKDILTQGHMDPRKTCVACSGCSQIMRDGAVTGCVIRDSDIYGPSYKLARRFALDRLRQEAQRCRDCEFATCTANCPAHVNVPGFIRAFADGDIRRAYDVLRRSNVLPEMCACVCPSEVQCEGGCLERIFAQHALPIRDIQLIVSRVARREGVTGVHVPVMPTPYAVAVAGGGPAGVACAIGLIERGHRVTIFEAAARLGGTPENVIPHSRYDTSADEIDAILAPARTAGRVEICCGRALGRDIALAQLRRRYAAVFLGLGLGRSTSLGEAPGVYDAIGFLGNAKSGRITAVGPKVAVLGGGNTAMDAAVTARRLGARDVYVVYRRSLAEMPAWPGQREEFLNSGGHLLILTQPLGYQTNRAGRLSGVRIARTELGEPDSSGRRSPKVVPGTESVLAVEMVIEALGQEVSAELQQSLDGIRLTTQGLVATADDSAATSLPGVFAGGDLVRGGATAVQGVADGMRAAAEIDRFLMASRTAKS